MSLNELYQEIILDHGKRPRNQGTLECPTHQAEGYNPLCGDQVKLELLVRDGVVADIRFSGAGCAISTASVSMMTQAVKGKSVREAVEFARQFIQALTREGEEVGEEMGELVALGGVKRFPSRVKCATLAWHALQSAFDSERKIISTE